MSLKEKFNSIFRGATAKSYFDKAADSFETGKNKEGLEYLDKAIAINPNYTDAWLQKGVIAFAAKQYEEALVCFYKVTTLDSDSIAACAWYYAGIIHHGAGRFIQAIECYDKILSIEPDYVGAWLQKGIACEALGRNDEALKLFEKVLASNAIDNGIATQAQKHIEKIKGVSAVGSMLDNVFDKAFVGLKLFYRDTKLPTELISNYQVMQIITERGITDMTHKEGGLTGNLRYVIATSNAKDLSIFEFTPDDGNFGLAVLRPGAFFKVLDIYKIGDKTQILLLEFPKVAAKIFKMMITTLEKDIIESVRNSFDKNVNAEPLPELQSSDWLERTKNPLGMSDDGRFFDLE